MLPIGSADSYGINYTGESNFLQNDHGNESHSVNRKKSKQNKNKIKVSTWIFVVSLMTSRVQHTIKIKWYSGIKCSYKSQQRNLRNLQKKEDRFNKVYDSDGGPGSFCDMEDLEDTQYFDEYDLPDFSWFWKNISDYQGNESVAEGGDKSNNDSYHTIHVKITSYQVKKTNVNQLKGTLGKEKPLYGTKKYQWKKFNNFERKFSTLYIWGKSENNQQNKKEDTSVTYLTKTVCWRALVTNAESVDMTTNPSF